MDDGCIYLLLGFLRISDMKVTSYTTSHALQATYVMIFLNNQGKCCLMLTSCEYQSGSPESIACQVCL